MTCGRGTSQPVLSFGGWEKARRCACRVQSTRCFVTGFSMTTEGAQPLAASVIIAARPSTRGHGTVEILMVSLPPRRSVTAHPVARDHTRPRLSHRLARRVLRLPRGGTG